MVPVATPQHGLANCENGGVRARKASKNTDGFVVRGVGWGSITGSTVDRLRRRPFVLSTIWTII